MSIQRASLRQLKVFEAAASNRSFSKAAQLLHLTQPGVSMHIKELESSAGLPLFERIGKKLHVTEAGQELLARVREILRSLKDAEEALAHQSGSGEHGQVLRAAAAGQLRQGLSAARHPARGE
jgi:DNA-binding transcriptional LysR family regulator